MNELNKKQQNDSNKKDQPEVPTENGFLSIVKTFLISAIITLAVIFGIRFAGIYTVNLAGESMAPTFHDGTFLALKRTEPTAGDIIVFTADPSWDKTESKKFIKRIVAVPGDKIIITRDGILVNNKRVKDLDEKYVSSMVGNLKLHEEIEVPKDKYFVLGDNYQHSNDSLYEMFHLNDKFLVDKDQIYTSGEKIFSFNYKFTK